MHPDLRFGEFLFQRLTDQALIRDAALGGFGFEGKHEGFGQAHVDAGGFGGAFPGKRFELGEVEGGEVLGEEGLGFLFSGHKGDGFHGASQAKVKLRILGAVVAWSTALAHNDCPRQNLQSKEAKSVLI